MNTVPAREPGRSMAVTVGTAAPTPAEGARATALLQQLLDADLAGYKPRVVLRRVAARVRRTGALSPAAYLAALEAGDAAAREEARQLQASFSVPVSAFFRNPRVFAALEQRVFPTLFAEGRDLRIWSAGCSRGQEPYSLAHALHRCAVRQGGSAEFSVLGTDVDAAALRQARAAVYSARRLEGVPERLRNEVFESIAEQRWQVRSHLRRRVRFAVGDLLDSAPPPAPEPFDLVACRNLLIYLERPAQEELIVGLLQALRPGGYLVLGTSETVLGRPWGLLEHVDPALRLYRRPA